MFGVMMFRWYAQALFFACIAALVSAQTAAPAPAPANPAEAKPALPPKSVTAEEVIESAIRQERRLADSMRYFKPIIETYIQEQKTDPDLRTSPANDDYFLSRLDLTGSEPKIQVFVGEERAKEGDKKKSSRNASFSALGFAEPLFPDLGHFDRQNYTFKFVRSEILGEVRCAVFDLHPRENSTNRGFIGRIWVEDQDFNVVRFTGTYTSKSFSQRSFHFDSWRLNTLGIMWMPAYIYTEESDPRDPSSHGLWFKAQTRIWGYDLQQAGDHHEYAKPLTDTPVWIDPKRHEASQDLSPAYTIGASTYTREDELVERLQLGGLMAPDGQVDQILETVTNNLLITNDLALAGVRCRVLLTTPLESFVVGRTIVLSRGLLDVLPDEATLAAVLAHELAHVVLGHSIGEKYLAGLALPFSDLEIFAHLNFSFDQQEEADADKKGLELFSKSPYDGQLANAALFLEALESRSPQMPNLLHGRFSNDFGRSHLIGMQALANFPKQLHMDRVDQMPALPLGSRILLDPWSDRIEMLKAKPARPLWASEKMPFEVSPFFINLKYHEQADSHEKPQPSAKSN